MQATLAKTELRREKSAVFRKRLKGSTVSYIMMLPYGIFFMIVTVIPVLSAIVLSFTSFNMLEMPEFVGLENYRRMMINDPNFITILKNTILYALITGPLGYFMSFFFAWLINELSPRLRAIMTTVFYMPTMVGNIFFVWIYIFSGDSYGIVNSVLISAGVIMEPVQWLSDASTMIFVVIVVQLWMSMGNGFLAFIAGFQGLDAALYEAGSIDGIRNRWQELWYITLPQLAPQLMFSAVMAISSAFGISAVISTMVGSPTTEYAADSIVTYMSDIGNIRYEMGYASALAVFLFALMLVFNSVIKNILRRYQTD
jgi:multiple sugar transport system permease protein